MTDNPYQKQPGDLEIRILPDGRVVFVAPDETLLAIAQALQSETPEPDTQETARHDRQPG